MGEICRIASVPAHTLRYWENHVGFLRPARRPSGHRRYTRGDVETIFFIRDLIERRKMTLAGVRKALIERKRGVRPSVEKADAGGENAASAATLKLLREVRKEIQLLVSELK